jgi:hypothetical protein
VRWVVAERDVTVEIRHEHPLKDRAAVYGVNHASNVEPPISF